MLLVTALFPKLALTLVRNLRPSGDGDDRWQVTRVTRARAHDGNVIVLVSQVCRHAGTGLQCRVTGQVRKSDEMEKGGKRKGRLGESVTRVYARPDHEFGPQSRTGATCRQDPWNGCNFEFEFQIRNQWVDQNDLQFGIISGSKGLNPVQCSRQPPICDEWPSRASSVTAPSPGATSRVPSGDTRRHQPGAIG